MGRMLTQTGVILVAMTAGVSIAGAQPVSFQVNDYWCGRLGGTFDGATCTAEYGPDVQACDKFEQLEPDDDGMRNTIADMRATDLCLADVVDAAKSNSMKLRADLMGYVTAGGDESRNDPAGSNASDIIERAKSGGAPYWPLASYYLYQCVVEICEGK